MKGILGLLRSKTLVNKPKDESTDSMLFSTAFAGQGVDDSMLVPWEARAVEVGAKATRQPGRQAAARLVGQRQVHGTPGQGRRGAHGALL